MAGVSPPGKLQQGTGIHEKIQAVQRQGSSMYKPFMITAVLEQPEAAPTA